MKSKQFPIGHPVVLTRETLLKPPNAPFPWTLPEHNTYKGLLLVRVLPPTTIMQGTPPLLGYRTHDGRLTFPLCAACADNKEQHICHHGDKKRSWVSGYTHVELNKALQLGYKVVDVHEVFINISAFFLIVIVMIVSDKPKTARATKMQTRNLILDFRILKNLVLNDSTHRCN